MLTLASTGELTREILGNHTPTSRTIFYVLALVSVVVFGVGVFRRARLWRRGRPQGSKTTLREGLARLVCDVLLQRRVFGRGKASVAHLLLFGGFALLFLGTALLAVEHGFATLLGRPADRPVFHKGVYFAVYELITDASGLALLAGCGWFVVRRWKRSAALAHDVRDWGVLAALVLLGISGYLVEGLRIIYEETPQPGFSFVGWLTAEAFTAVGVTPEAAATLHFGLWWMHALVALGFVAAFPYTRLLHALAGTMRLAAGPTPLGAMIRLDAEEVEKTGVIGVGSVEQFTRWQLVELDACVSCGRCEEACPAFEAGKPLSPRALVQDIRRHLDATAPPPLQGGTIAAETLWSCTTCSACTAVCPLGVNPLGLITDMRRHLIAEAQLRGSPAAALQKMDRSGNPWGLHSEDRLAWASGLNVPTVNDRPDFEVLYWVGCAAAYDRRAQKVARSVIRLLIAAGVKFAVLGPEERCTGESARRMGDEFLFQQMAAANVEILNHHGVNRSTKPIVTHCPHCLNSLKQDYPQMGGNYEVLHHTEFLAKLAAEGRLPLEHSALDPVARRVTYHDPCYLARVGGVTEPPRQLLQLGLPGSLVEMPRRGAQTACCGAGGGRMWFDDKPAERIGTSRVEEALATGAATVAVSCPFCLTMLTDGMAGRNAGVQVRDIAEILADALPAV